MVQVKRLLVAGSLAASVLAGGALFGAKPAAADDWDHPLRKVVRVLLGDGTYANRNYYYDYNHGRYVPYNTWLRERDHWRRDHWDHDDYVRWHNGRYNHDDVIRWSRQYPERHNNDRDHRDRDDHGDRGDRGRHGHD